MEFYEVLKRRRSIRNYKTDPVSPEQLARIAEAVAVSPSACNRQPWKVIVVTNPEKLAAIRAACPQRVLNNAPAVAAVVGDAASAWRRPEGNSIVDVDAAIVMEHIVLAATAEGLGSCWICAYDMSKVNAAFGVSGSLNVCALTPLGYAASPAADIARKPVSEIFEIQS